MKMLLLADVKNLGKQGEIIEVSDGYARNFLLPKKLGKPATEGTVRAKEKEKLDQISKKQREIEAMKAHAEVLATQEVTVKARVGDGGKFFGSITSQDIATALKEQYNQDFDKRKIQLPEPIRSLGTHDVSIRLSPEVVAHVKVKVTALEEKHGH